MSKETTPIQRTEENEGNESAGVSRKHASANDKRQCQKSDRNVATCTSGGYHEKDHG